MEFNELKKVGLFELLSKRGKEVFMPQGVFHWVNRAKKEANIDATIGVGRGLKSEISDTASSDPTILYLPSIDAMFNGLEPEEVFPYASPTGLPAFRQAWKEWQIWKMKQQHGDNAKLPSLMTPIVTSGLTGALHTLSTLFIDPEETVIAPDKRWGVYDMTMSQLIGARLESVPLFLQGRINVQGFAEALIKTAQKQHKMLLILNFPHNPTGFMPDPQNVQELNDALITVVEKTGKDLVIFLDDAYEGLVYDQNVRQWSLFSDLATLHPKILPIKIDGISKEFFFWGGRIGCITFPLMSHWDKHEEIECELENKVSAIIRGTVSNSCRLVQGLMAKLLNENREQLLQERNRLIKVISERAHLLRKELEALTGPVVQPDPFNAGLFALLNIQGISACKFADHLLRHYGIGTVAFEKEERGLNGIRITFGSVIKEDIPKVVECIGKTIKDMSDK
ncbi:MAG: aminotransferase class I/II-fold pyridoxal phosphate-dependent enzyme [Candidatus Scalindua sp.]